VGYLSSGIAWSVTTICTAIFVGWEEREVGLGDIVWNFGSLLIPKA
jgi:hypothetical protein